MEFVDETNFHKVYQIEGWRINEKNTSWKKQNKNETFNFVFRHNLSWKSMTDALPSSILKTQCKIIKVCWIFFILCLTLITARLIEHQFIIYSYGFSFLNIWVCCKEFVQWSKAYKNVLSSHYCFHYFFLLCQISIRSTCRKFSFQISHKNHICFIINLVTTYFAGNKDRKRLRRFKRLASWL